MIALLKQEREALIKAGLDVDFMIRQLEGLLEELQEGEARIDELKRQMLKSLSMSVIEQVDGCVAPSDHLDMAAPDMRNNDDVIEYFKRHRKRTRRFTPDEEEMARNSESN